MSKTTRKIGLRTIPKDIRPAVQRYAIQVGEVTWAWNHLHSMLHIVFANLIEDDIKTAIPIWHSQKSDDGQRSLLAATARIKLAKQQRLLKQLLWVIESAGRLAAYRNDAIHTPFMAEKIRGRWKLVPEPFTGHLPRVQRLTTAGHEKLFRLLRGDLLALSSYAGRIWREIRIPGLLGPLPRKPALQSLRLVQAQKSGHNKTPRRQSRAKRPPPPRSSRG
jgi:hypothetical protein